MSSCFGSWVTGAGDSMVCSSVEFVSTAGAGAACSSGAMAVFAWSICSEVSVIVYLMVVRM